MKPTCKLRIVVRSPLTYSQRTLSVWQQWWASGSRGEWRDVPIEKEFYFLPDARTK